MILSVVDATLSVGNNELALFAAADIVGCFAATDTVGHFAATHIDDYVS